MNFTFLMECEDSDPGVTGAYREIGKILEEAENCYWDKPRESGILFRKATEQICRLYNIRFHIGFPENASLADFLCYTEEQEHNVLVSCFLSTVRKEQRDRLNKLRLIGDDCVLGDAAPDRGMKPGEQIRQDTEHMAMMMMPTVREVCARISGRTDLGCGMFRPEILPGYVAPPDPPVIHRKKKKGFFAGIFGGGR